MATIEKVGECHTYKPEEKKYLFFIMRLISGIGVIPFLFLFIVYFKRRKAFTVMMALNLQLAISQFIGNATNAIPMIDTFALQNSFLCPLQAIVTGIASLARDCFVFVIIYYSYLGFSNQEYIQKSAKKLTIQVSVASWIISIAGAFLSLLGNIESSPSCLCRAKDDSIKAFVFSFFGISAIASNYVIIKLLFEMKEAIIKYINLGNPVGGYYCIRYTKPFLYYNIPIFLQLIVVILRSLRFGDVVPSFGMTFTIEVSRVVVRILIVLAFCYNKTVWKDCGKILTCKEIDINDDEPDIDNSFQNERLTLDDSKNELIRQSINESN